MIFHFAEKNLIFRNSQRREFVLTSPGIMFYENTCRVEKQNQNPVLVSKWINGHDILNIQIY